MRWKGFMAENNTWERKEDLENIKELVNKFEKRLEAEVRWQEEINKRWKVKLNINKEEFRKSELPEKYIAKVLFRWNDKKFEDEYLKKLERSWER